MRKTERNIILTKNGEVNIKLTEEGIEMPFISSLITMREIAGFKDQGFPVLLRQGGDETIVVIKTNQFFD